MKKRCTASACRRYFDRSLGKCPYCGKLYPQLFPVVRFTLTGLHGKTTVFLFRTLGKLLSKSTLTAREIVLDLKSGTPYALPPVFASDREALIRELNAWRLSYREEPAVLRSGEYEEAGRIHTWLLEGELPSRRHDPHPVDAEYLMPVVMLNDHCSPMGGLLAQSRSPIKLTK